MQLSSMKKILLATIIAVSALAVACDGIYTDAWDVPIIKLGAYEKVFYPETAEGDLTIRVTSNVPYEARVATGAEWIKFVTENEAHKTVMPCSGGGDLVVHYGANLYGKRLGHIVLEAEGRRDTVFIKQQGVYEDHFAIYDEDKALFASGTTLNVPEAGQSYSIRINCTEIAANVKSKTTDPDFVTNLLFEHDVLSFTVEPNTYERPRQAQVELAYVNGWNEKEVLTIYIDQEYVLRLE